MTRPAEDVMRWVDQAPKAARPLKDLMLCHPRIVRRLALFLASSCQVTQAADGVIEVHMGDRGFDITSNGVEPWKRAEHDPADPADWREWSAVQAPWDAQTDLGRSLWTIALDEFDGLIRQGVIELVGRFDSLRSPASYIPPSGIAENIWHTPRADYGAGTLVLSNGEIVYDVHILNAVPPEMGASPHTERLHRMASEDALRDWIFAKAAASPDAKTHAVATLLMQCGEIGLSKGAVRRAWDAAMSRLDPGIRAVWQGPGTLRTMNRSPQSIPEK